MHQNLTSQICHEGKKIKSLIVEVYYYIIAPNRHLKSFLEDSAPN